MNRNLVGIALSILYVSLVLALATLLHKKRAVGPEGSRKLVHIGVSCWWLIAMRCFDSPLWAAAVPLLFVAVNLFSHHSGAISAMERPGEANSLGTVFYPISLTVLALICFGGISEPYVGALGALIMGWGDGLAALFGMRFGRRRGRSRKTPEGCLCMFAVSFLVAALILRVYAPDGALGRSALIALFATVVEAMSPRGADNLTVPLLVPVFYQIIYL